MTEITTQEWCDIANEIEPKTEGKEWVCRKNNTVVLIEKHTGVSLAFYYSPSSVSEQQLRLADYLAEKGVVVIYAEEMKMYAAFITDAPISKLKSEHKDINMCRALAVLALIKENRK